MAKFDARRTAAVLENPAAVRAVLLHGDDAGLMRERAEALVRAVLGGATDDPFRVADLAREEAARLGTLAGEMAALAMTGGRRVVRLREATDAHASALREALSGAGEALLIMEGGELTARSKLRSFAEAAPDVAVIACYRERGDELAGSIGRLLREAKVEADPSVLSWLATRLSEDRMLMRREVEKLALYVGPGGRVDEEAALACGVEDAGGQIDKALMAATVGDVTTSDRALDKALAEGANPVQLVRTALRHMQRLHEASSAGGDSTVLRPPVFFRHKQDFDKALRIWSLGALEAAATGLLETEKKLKTSAFRESDSILVRTAIATLARQAAGYARR